MSDVSRPVPGRFEERLLSELKRVVTERTADAATNTAPASRRSRPRLAFAGAVAVAGGAAVVAVAVASGGGTPAYAVTTSSGGVVWVTANYLGDPAEANRELHRAGVPVVVMPAVPADRCPADERGRVVPGEDGGQGTPIVVDHIRGTKLRIPWIRGAAPPGRLLVLAPQAAPGTGELVMVIDEYYEPGPRCVAAGVPGTRGGPIPIESLNAFDSGQPRATGSPRVLPSAVRPVPLRSATTSR